MREARCETPGMRIPLLGGYRSSKRLADLWREYSLSSVAFCCSGEEVVPSEPPKKDRIRKTTK